MAENPNSTDPEENGPPWRGITSFLLVAVLVILIYLLGQSMVHHRFFRGGWMNQSGTLNP